MAFNNTINEKVCQICYCNVLCFWCPS